MAVRGHRGHTYSSSSKYGSTFNGLPNEALEIDPFQVKVLEVVAWRKRALYRPVVN
jgi:hypothetical protein